MFRSTESSRPSSSGISNCWFLSTGFLSIFDGGFSRPHAQSGQLLPWYEYSLGEARKRILMASIELFLCPLQFSTFPGKTSHNITFNPARFLVYLALIWWIYSIRSTSATFATFLWLQSTLLRCFEVHCWGSLFSCTTFCKSKTYWSGNETSVVIAKFQLCRYCESELSVVKGLQTLTWFYILRHLVTSI